MDRKHLTWWLGLAVFLGGIAAGVHGLSRHDDLGIADGAFLMVWGPAAALLLMVAAVASSMLRPPPLAPAFVATTALLALVAGGVAASLVIEFDAVGTGSTFALLNVAALAFVVSVAALVRLERAVAVA